MQIQQPEKITPTKNDYLKPITSLRGIAAALVILLHFNVFCFALAPWDGHLDHFIQKGYLWVDFFFLLSGFIMMHVYSKLFENNIKENFWSFMRARFARIYPLHLFSFLCMLVFYFWYKNHFTLYPTDYLYTFNFDTIWANLLLVHSMGIYKNLSWDTASWSISVEWWMYVVFPFLLIPFRKIIQQKKFLIFLGILSGYLFIAYYLYPISALTNGSLDPSVKSKLDVTYDFGFVRCFFGFLFGMFIYELYRARWRYTYLKQNITWIISIISAIIVMSFNTPDFVPVLAFSAIILSSLHTDGFGKKILSFKPFVFLGDISYSVYLMHLPIMMFILNFLRFEKIPWIKMENLTWSMAWLYAFIYLTIVIIISTLTYYFVEVPMRKRLNKSVTRN